MNSQLESGIGWSRDIRHDPVSSLTDYGGYMSIHPAASAAFQIYEIAVELGQAVAIIDRVRMTPPMRELLSDEGFPALPLHELRLASPPGERSPACAHLAALIAEGFRL